MFKYSDFSAERATYHHRELPAEDGVTDGMINVACFLRVCRFVSLSLPLGPCVVGPQSSVGCVGSLAQVPIRTFLTF
jgi:hypothetical protein